MTYQDTIKSLQEARGDRPLRGACHTLCEALIYIHPELALVRGHYLCPVNGPQPHWWTVAPNGTVVDPTKEQFTFPGMGIYEPWDESLPEPTGKCMNCGGLVFERHDNICSDDCGDAYAAYLMGSL